jgi:hypothetical protein
MFEAPLVFETLAAMSLKLSNPQLGLQGSVEPLSKLTEYL